SKPYTLFEEIALLSAYKKNIFENADKSDIKRLADELLTYLHNNCASVENAVNTTGDITDENEKRLADSLINFKDSCSNGEHQ
ncbi:MAG: hypothetical protein ACI4FN_06275, partial [Acutalibacteraceae bacterium]